MDARDNFPLDFPKDETYSRELVDPTASGLPVLDSMPRMRDVDAGTPSAPPAFYLTAGASNSGWRPGGAEYGLFPGSIPSAIKFSHMSAPPAADDSAADGSDDEDACEEVPLAAMKAVGMKQLLPAAATERMQKGDLIEIENEEEVTPGRSETTFVYLRASAYERFVPARLRGRSRIDSLTVWLHGGLGTRTVNAKNPLVLSDAELRSPNAVRITRLWRQSDEMMSVVHIKLKEARNLEKQGVARLARLVAPGEVATKGTPGEPVATQEQRIAALEQRLAAAEQHRTASDQRLAASEQLVASLVEQINNKRRISAADGDEADCACASAAGGPSSAQALGLAPQGSNMDGSLPSYHAEAYAEATGAARRKCAAHPPFEVRTHSTAGNAQAHHALATPHPSHQPYYLACNRAAGAIVAIALRRLSPE